jgi:hypothetical protein
MREARVAVVIDPRLGDYETTLTPSNPPIADTYDWCLGLRGDCIQSG